MKALRSLWYDEDGLTTVEYALLLALIVVGAAGIWVSLGDSITNQVDAAASELDSTPGG